MQEAYDIANLQHVPYNTRAISTSKRCIVHYLSMYTTGISGTLGVVSAGE
jgi:hypothetical protein